MRHKNDSLGEMLFKAPWWVSVCLGVVSFIGLRWGFPAWAGDDTGKKAFAGIFVSLAPVILLAFGGMAVASFIFSQRRGRLVDDQTGLESIRNTPWKEFEFLVAEAYRRKGYQVEYFLNEGADGGVDLVLRKDGCTSLVQCKRWKTVSVGAPVIREMFGLMTAERADEVIVVTSGDFTRDARMFADGKPIRLVNGTQLLALVRSVQSQTEATSPEAAGTETGSPAAPTCPQCGKQMILRTARRGNNAGNQFWGCPTYPACSGTRSV